ncbi:hypothetical protein MNBD_DELTA01-1149, partial [hydrothermal vent metagenome]
GTTSISTSSNPGEVAASSITSPAMPYTPASPLLTIATVSPLAAIFRAFLQRSTSSVIFEVTTRWPESSGLISETYLL